MLIGETGALYNQELHGIKILIIYLLPSRSGPPQYSQQTGQPGWRPQSSNRNIGFCVVNNCVIHNSKPPLYTTTNKAEGYKQIKGQMEFF